MLADLDARLAEINGTRKWILAVDVAAMTTGLIETLTSWGVADIMIVAATEGVGALPQDLPIHYTRTTGDTLMGGLRNFLDSVGDPSPELRAAIDAFDPAGEAFVITPPFGTMTDVAGRVVHGARPAEIASLEDKMIVDELWDAAGVARAPSAVVAVQDAVRHHARLEGPLGTVWVADNREGWHGGADYVRWVRHRHDLARAYGWFLEHADRVRVMPFLDGVACSIHGYVTGNGVAVFRPVEIIVLRTGEPGFRYAGVCSAWDPPGWIREEMRSAARAVGRVLDARYRYRGGFSIDGVCTRDGFRPTELNPRLSAGLGTLARAVPDLPLGFVTRALVAGEMDVDAGWLEETIVAAADANRTGGMGLSVPNVVSSASATLRFEDGRALAVAAEDTADATLQVGPSPSGSYLGMRLDPEAVPPGPSVGALAVAATDFARREWGVDVPPVTAAPDWFNEPR